MNHRPGFRPLVTCALILIAAVLGGCAHYQIGNRTLYRSDIRTVHVPMFPSHSFRRGLGERVTEAVIKEIHASTPYKVVSADMADTVLSGELIFDRKHVLGLNQFDEPRILRDDLMIMYTWTDRRGRILAQPVPLEISPALAGETTMNEGSFVPEAGQSVTTAQEQAIRNFAKEVVRGMQSPW
jgi:hypothetical protein